MTSEELVNKLIKQGVPESTAKTFVKFHKKNPHIWEAFRDATLSLIAARKKHWGAKAIFEHLRYRTAITGDEEFKINNNYPAYYTRMWAIAFPRYANFFETRELTGLSVLPGGRVTKQVTNE